jgi:catechol 2,3-dioxygenase-like lactoylglutathione lyase family enzyme
MTTQTMRPRAVLETVLYCPDLDAAREFYTGVLGLELAAAQTERHVFLRCGDGMLLLFNPEHTSRVAVPIAGTVVPLHGGRGPGHMAFRATREEIARWRGHLQEHGVAVETEIEWPGGGRSLYFRDPAGNSLEFATPELWGL